MRVIVDGIVVSCGGWNITNDRLQGRLFLNGGCGIERAHGYFSPQLLAELLLSPITARLEEVIVLSGRWTYNYYHFMTEVCRAGLGQCHGGLVLLPHVYVREFSIEAHCCAYVAAICMQYAAGIVLLIACLRGFLCGCVVFVVACVSVLRLSGRTLVQNVNV